MKQTYIKCLKQLKIFRKSINNESEYVKKAILYFEWIKNKTQKIQQEIDEGFVYNELVGKTLTRYNINKYEYEKSNKYVKRVIDENYEFDGKKYKFYNNNILYEEVKIITKNIILRRGNVVWIDFGFNIGNEFGGMHPAIILKNFENELFVLPVSSKKPLEYEKIEQLYKEDQITLEECERQKEKITNIIQLDKIYGFKNIIRWANITRMKKVSILRLNFSGSVGTISGEYMNEITEKIKKEF